MNEANVASPHYLFMGVLLEIIHRTARSHNYPPLEGGSKFASGAKQISGRGDGLRLHSRLRRRYVHAEARSHGGINLTGQDSLGLILAEAGKEQRVLFGKANELGPRLRGDDKLFYVVVSAPPRLCVPNFPSTHGVAGSSE